MLSYALEDRSLNISPIFLQGSLLPKLEDLILGVCLDLPNSRKIPRNFCL